MPPPDENESRDRKQLEERLRLFTEASTALASTIDYDATLAAIAHLLVPGVADGCIIDVVESDDALRRVIGVDADESKNEAMDALAEMPPPPRSAPVYRVLELELATVAREIKDEELAASARSPEHLRLLRELAPRSGIIAPLRARGRSIGILWVYASRSGRVYDQESASIVQEIANRIAVALDNARLYREAQEAIALRDEFLTIASHELRTPLTPLKLQIARLRRSASAEVAGRLEIADRQVDRLTRLVNQLLDVSRIATLGKNGSSFPLDVQDVDLAAVVRSVAEDLALDLDRSGSTLALELPAEARGRWDPLRMEQVVSNLLSNAIKYGAGAPVHVALTTTEEGVTLTVTDMGLGIDRAHQERIFGRFERAVSTRHYGGFGLGLWIVRQIVEASGGTIAVESPVTRTRVPLTLTPVPSGIATPTEHASGPRGSRFTVTLPRSR